MEKVRIEQALSGILRIAVIRLGGVQMPADSGESLWGEMAATVDELAERYMGIQISTIPGIQEVRKLYRAVGLDPTKTRPSSEALLRRVIKGKGLYRIHPLVDCFNLISLQQLLPVGLYDEKKIQGEDCMVRIGQEGWGFDGIRKSRVNVAGRLCIADAEGPFGSPTSDSLRTSIGGEGGDATDVLAVYYTHAADDPGRLENALAQSIKYSEKYFGAVCVEKYLVPQ